MTYRDELLTAERRVEQLQDELNTLPPSPSYALVWIFAAVPFFCALFLLPLVWPKRMPGNPPHNRSHHLELVPLPPLVATLSESSVEGVVVPMEEHGELHLVAFDDGLGWAPRWRSEPIPPGAQYHLAGSAIIVDSDHSYDVMTGRRTVVKEPLDPCPRPCVQKDDYKSPKMTADARWVDHEITLHVQTSPPYAEVLQGSATLWNGSLSLAADDVVDESSHVVYLPNRVIVAYQTPGGTGRIVARDAHNGGVRWTATFEKEAIDSLNAKRRVYAIVGKALHVYDPANGTELQVLSSVDME